MAHLTWSIEKDDGRCPDCNTETVLLMAYNVWDLDVESAAKRIGVELADSLSHDGVQIAEEVSGHWCHKCEKLCSLSLNTL